MTEFSELKDSENIFHEMHRKPKILLACTGSVASLKVPNLIDALQEMELQVVYLKLKY